MLFKEIYFALGQFTDLRKLKNKKNPFNRSVKVNKDLLASALHKTKELAKRRSKLSFLIIDKKEESKESTSLTSSTLGMKNQKNIKVYKLGAKRNSIQKSLQVKIKFYFRKINLRRRDIQKKIR